MGKRRGVKLKWRVQTVSSYTKLVGDDLGKKEKYK